MKIKEVNTSKKVGYFKLEEKIKEEWGCNYVIKFFPEFSDKFSKIEYEDDTPRVYLIVINGVIKKIGGSSSRGGIKTTISFYENATQGSPGPVRFVIHQLIGEELEKNNDVEIYMITSPKVEAIVNGLFGSYNIQIASFKEMEDRCKFEYVIFTLEEFLKNNSNTDNKELKKNLKKLKDRLESLKTLDNDFAELKKLIFDSDMKDVKEFLDDLKEEFKEKNNYFFKNVLSKINKDKIKKELKEYYDDFEKIKNFLYEKLYAKYNEVLSKPKKALNSSLKKLKDDLKINLKIFPDWNFQENNEPYPNRIYQQYLEYHENRTSNK